MLDKRAATTTAARTQDFNAFLEESDSDEKPKAKAAPQVKSPEPASANTSPAASPSGQEQREPSIRRGVTSCRMASASQSPKSFKSGIH